MSTKYIKLLDFDPEDDDILDDEVETDAEFAIDENYDESMKSLQHCVLNRLICNVYYKAEQNGVVLQGNRRIEPYTIGVSRKGHIVVRAWLLSGISKTGNERINVTPGWRLFRVDRIYNIGVTYNTFTIPRKGYNKEDRGMSEIMQTANF